MQKRVRTQFSTALVTIGLAMLAGLSGPYVTAGGATPTILPPPNATPRSDGLYFHPSALFSIPHLVGWELAPGGVETFNPTQGSTLSRAGAAFINSSALSVVHVFVDRDPSRTVKQLADLGTYYDKQNLDAAWSKFTGGWKELERHVEGDKYVINFELYMNNQVYLARQISQFAGEWLKTNRLVVPQNNPKLLGALQQKMWAAYTVYPAEGGVPLAWSSIIDGVSGYIVRYPTAWTVQTGKAAAARTITGRFASQIDARMTVDTTPRKAILSQVAARAWITALYTKATIQTLRSATLNGTTGFDISYTYPDLTASNQTESAVATLLNGTNGTLYALTLVMPGSNVDMLGHDPTLPPEIAQIRSTFLLIHATAVFEATTAPTQTAMPVPLTPTLNPASLDFNTATLYRTDDGVVEIKLPTGWHATMVPSANGIRAYAFANSEIVSSDAPVFLGFQISSEQALYHSISGFINDQTGKVNSPQTALQAIIEFAKSSGAPTVFSPVHTAKIGSLDGQGFTSHIPANPPGVPTAQDFDTRIARLPPDKAVFLAGRSDSNLWDMAHPLLNQMIDSIVIHTENIPSGTPTPNPQIPTAISQSTQVAATPTGSFIWPYTIQSTLNPPFVPAEGQ